MPDPVHLQLDRLGDVVADELEPGMANPARDVGLAPGEVVIETDHLVAGVHQAIDEVGAEEAGTSSDEMNYHVNKSSTSISRTINKHIKKLHQALRKRNNQINSKP